MAGRQIESVQPTTDAHFIDGDERDEYVDRPLRLLGIRHEPKAKFGPRWIVEAAMLDTGEKVLISLADNATRTAMFAQVREDLDDDGADAYEPMVLFRQSRAGGNAFWTFRTATADELAAAAETAANRVDEPDDPAAGENDAEAATPRGRGRR